MLMMRKMTTTTTMRASSVTPQEKSSAGWFPVNLNAFDPNSQLIQKN